MTTALLLVLAGRPGTGKTTLSRGVAPALHAAVLRVDAIEAAVIRCELARRPVGTIGYVVAHEIAKATLAVGTSVVVDAVNPVPEARAGWRALADEVGVRIVVVETSISDETEHRRRVDERRPDLEGQHVPTWDEVTRTDYVAWDENRDGIRLAVDTTDLISARDAVLRHTRT